MRAFARWMPPYPAFSALRSRGSRQAGTISERRMSNTRMEGRGVNGQRRPAQGEMLLKLDGKGLPQFRVCGEHSDVAATQTDGGGDAEAGNDDEGDAFVQQRSRSTRSCLVSR